MTEEHDDLSQSRRKFLKNTGVFAGGVLGGSVLGGLLTNQFMPTKEKTKGTKESADLQDARVFFSRKNDFEVLAAATEVIFPKDDLGPGAIALGVPYFIDKQLASSWGTNAKEYMSDPFWQNEQTENYQYQDARQDQSGPNVETKAPTPTPRYQTRLNRGDIFLQGVKKIDDVSKEKFNESFVKLEEEEQIQVLEDFENGTVEMNGIAAVTFFNLLLQMTLEGAYADPVYGGNKDMMGWKMKEYPGPRMSYLDQIEDEEFIVMKQESLRDYQG